MNNRARTPQGRRDDWETPPAFFAEIAERYGPFTLDAAALPHNAKVSTFYTPEDDGLRQPWLNRTWLNPPYGKQISPWLEKAVREAELGVTTVALLPAHTDTRWFHDLVLPYADLEFVRGRVQFIGTTSSNPTGSIIAVYRPKRAERAGRLAYHREGAALARAFVAGERERTAR